MYQVLNDMSIREYAVKHAIRVLQKRRAKFDYYDIASEIGCSIETVKRAMPRLLKAGVIIRIGSNRQGWRYECIES